MSNRIITSNLTSDNIYVYDYDFNLQYSVPIDYDRFRRNRVIGNDYFLMAQWDRNLEIYKLEKRDLSNGDLVNELLSGDGNLRDISCNADKSVVYALVDDDVIEVDIETGDTLNTVSVPIPTPTLVSSNYNGFIVVRGVDGLRTLDSSFNTVKSLELVQSNRPILDGDNNTYYTYENDRVAMFDSSGVEQFDVSISNLTGIDVLPICVYPYGDYLFVGGWDRSSSDDVSSMFILDKSDGSFVDTINYPDLDGEIIRGITVSEQEDIIFEADPYVAKVDINDYSMIDFFQAEEALRDESGVAVESGEYYEGYWGLELPLKRSANVDLKLDIQGTFNVPIIKNGNVDLKLGLYGSYNLDRTYSGNVDLGISIYSGEYTIEDFTPPPDIRLYGSFVKYKEMETIYKKVQSLSARYSNVIELDLDD